MGVGSRQNSCSCGMRPRAKRSCVDVPVGGLVPPGVQGQSPAGVPKGRGPLAEKVYPLIIVCKTKLHEKHSKLRQCRHLVAITSQTLPKDGRRTELYRVVTSRHCRPSICTHPYTQSTATVGNGEGWYHAGLEWSVLPSLLTGQSQNSYTVPV